MTRRDFHARRGGPVSRYLLARASLALEHLTEACRRFLRHEMSTYAAALAYRGLLALFPFVIFIIALVNTVDASRPFDMLADWARTAPQGRVPNAIKEWLVWQTRARAEGPVLSMAGVAAAWAVASGARVLRRALNEAAEMPEEQPPWMRLVVSLVAAPLLGAMILGAIALFTVTREFLYRLAVWFDVNQALLGFWDWIRLPAGLVLFALVIAALYRYAPSHRQSLRVVFPGAMLAALVWAAALLILSRAVGGLLHFGVTYGSFSAAIGLLVYLYIGAAGLLFGAEVNSALCDRERRSDPASPIELGKPATSRR